MYSSCCLFMLFVYVSRFSFFLFYIDWTVGFSFEWFFTCHFGALYSLLFGVSQGSVLKAVPWPIIVYFCKLLFGWRVVWLALITHLYIPIVSFSAFDVLSCTRKVGISLSHLSHKLLLYLSRIIIQPIRSYLVISN